jgi:hypothetical protein
MLAGSHSGLMFAAPLLGGDAGTEQTIRMIRRLVDDAWKDPFVNRGAIEIIRNAGVPEYDSLGQVRALYDFAHSFYFINDPVTKETLRPARELLQLRAGDCDDINAIVLPSLLGTVGFETRIVTIAADAQTPDSFSHVYCEVNLDGQWVPLDAARPGAVFGVAPPNFYRREWWSLVDASHGDYSGMAGLPAIAPDFGATAGYQIEGVPMLNGVATLVSTGLADAGNLLRSVSGQNVQNAVQGAIGPGGSTSVSPGVAPGSNLTTELLVLGLGLGLIWWLAQ